MKTYDTIIKHYEACLEKHGDTHLGVDWPKADDAEKRYKIMLDIINLRPNTEVNILDFGCGTAHMYEYILKNNLSNIKYAGLDISEKFVAVSCNKYPAINFYCGDVLDAKFELPKYDYILMNGVFTEKRELSFDEMWQYLTNVLTKVYTQCNKGVAFNVMSKQVDWERDDLFHVSLDKLSEFLCKNISRNYVVRNDYGLYEYTVYIYKKAL